MKILKQNIVSAITICLISLFVFSVFQFTDTDKLAEIISANSELSELAVEAENIRSFFIALSSGVFASTLVALFFYINEYQRKKEDVIRRLITINRQVCSIYKEITYIPFTWDTEYGKLVLSYYLEYYDNELKRKMKIENAKMLKKYPVKIRKQLSKVISKQFTFAPNQLHKKELHNYLTDHPHLLEIGTNNIKLSPEQKMQDVITELDDKIDRLKKLYAKIRVLDLRELDNCVQEVNAFTRFTIFKKIKIKHNIPDSKIFPEINKLGLNEIARRIYNTHERITNLIDGWYKHDRVGEQGKYNKKEMISLMLMLQNTFLGNNIMSIKSENCVHNIGYMYNIILFVEANLEQILLYDLYGILKFKDRGNFALTKDSIENGQKITVTHVSGTDLISDIFRP